MVCFMYAVEVYRIQNPFYNFELHNHPLENITLQLQV